MAPAGKSTRRLSLLSGGEKSLVALAFVFAVLMARPCPFYILDEVEAAGGPHALADTTVALWRAFAAAEPDADFTRIFPFIESSG